jgi:hypothetical protein
VAGYKRRNTEGRRERPEAVLETFPVKQNREFFMPLLYPPNTWMIDIMFSTTQEKGEDLAYLLMVNPLTRYAYAGLLNPVVRGRV